jgi:hypothetical protein
MNRRGLAIFSAIVVGALLRPAPGAIVLVLIGGIAVMLAFVFAYSYRVWKTDPQRRAT